MGDPLTGVGEFEQLGGLHLVEGVADRAVIFAGDCDQAEGAVTGEHWAIHDGVLGVGVVMIWIA